MVYYITRPTWPKNSELDPDDWKRFRKHNIWGAKHFKKDESMWNLFYEVVFKKGGKIEGNEEDRGEFEIGDDLRFLWGLEKGKCPVCGGELKGGYFRGYGRRLRGDVFRLGWNLWVYVPKKKRKKNKREVEYGE
jgi:hypothetical protein